MRKYWYILVACLFLTGCSTKETFETLGQIDHQQQIPAEAASVILSIPESASLEVFGGDGRVYDCDGFALVIQTLSGGDIYATVQQISGFHPTKLTMLESSVGNAKRYDWVWTAMADNGQMMCRAAVLDDGNYHYCVYTMAPATDAGALTAQWNQLYGSVRLK